MVNPKLEVGDRVMVLYMDDPYPVDAGTWGTVTGSNVIQGTLQYEVNWDNGTQEKVGDKIVSKLSLISITDAWTKNPSKKRVKESVITKKKLIEDINKLDKDWERDLYLIDNKKTFSNFDMRFFKKYLDTLKETGIVNMFGASPYLYMGRNRIEHEFKYQDIPNEESFEQLLDMADESQAKMIDGVIKVLESENRESDLTNINNTLKRYSSKVLMGWIVLYYK